MKNSTSTQHTRAASVRNDKQPIRLTRRGKKWTGIGIGFVATVAIAAGTASAVAEQSEQKAMDKRVASENTLTIAAQTDENPTQVERRAYQNSKVPPALAAAIIRAIAAQEQASHDGTRMLIEGQAVDIPIDPQAPLKSEYQHLYEETLAAQDRPVSAGAHD